MSVSTASDPAMLTSLLRAYEKRASMFAKSSGRPVALRVFHGPGEGEGILLNLAIDRFGDHYWVTEWEDQARGRNAGEDFSALRGTLSGFFEKIGAASAVALWRPEKGIPAEPETIWGEPPEGRFSVEEGPARFAIQLRKARHPGLFLDQAPLREWLRTNLPRSARVLNTFAYTGSLSIAAALGGAAHVTTLDLSKATIEWARENWALNALAPDRGAFIYGDVFEWLPRLKRAGRVFEAVILDPPSFSRGKKGTFSTLKDLPALHVLAIPLVAPGGLLITSINSAKVSRGKYESDIAQAADAVGARFRTVREIELPPTFPVRRPEDRYLKGWVLERLR